MHFRVFLCIWEERANIPSSDLTITIIPVRAVLSEDLGLTSDCIQERLHPSSFV